MRATARERLRALIRLYSERMNTDAMAIELAIRQWARGDEKAAVAVASVDAARLRNVGQLYRATGLDADEAAIDHKKDDHKKDEAKPDAPKPDAPKPETPKQDAPKK